MIEIEIEKNWIDNDGYKDFILEQSENGTVFHLPEFLNYHNDIFFADTEKYLIKFIKDNKVIAGISGVLKVEDDQKCFISPFGASYGGLVVKADLDYHEYEIIYDLLIKFLRTIVHCVKITGTSAFHSRMNKSIYNDYILLAKGFNVLKSDLLLVHELDDNEKLVKRLDKKTATELKQPLNNHNLDLQVTGGVEELTYDLLLSSQERLGSKPTHTLEELNRIESLVPGTIHSFNIQHSGKLVAGIICFRTNKNVLNSFYIFDGLDARAVKANHFSYYNVLKWARENNYKYLDFGPSSFGYIPNYPLIKFKEKFDSKPFLRNSYKMVFN